MPASTRCNIRGAFASTIKNRFCLWTDFDFVLSLTRLQARLHVKCATEENKNRPFSNTVPFIHCKIAQKEMKHLNLINVFIMFAKETCFKKGDWHEFSRPSEILTGCTHDTLMELWKFHGATLSCPPTCFKYNLDKTWHWFYLLFFFFLAYF